jgi:hypothetical protein
VGPGKNDENTSNAADETDSPPRVRTLGADVGRGFIAPDFDAPMPDDEAEAWETPVDLL